MKTKILIAAGIGLIAVAVTLVAMKSSNHSNHPSSNAGQTAHTSSNANHSSQQRIPKFYETPPTNLPPTLEPERFMGKTQAAYRAVREIPKTIAQLPCYCYCDEGHGHKSLYSCYEDDHAGSCAVCVDEVLLAYRLQKEQGLSAVEVRKRIIAQFSRME